MAVDIIARGLAANALKMLAEGGGGAGGVGIEKIEIKNGNLWVTMTGKPPMDLGRVVGKDGKVYVPHLDENNVLSWTIEDKEGKLPRPVDITNNGEWSDIENQGETQYVWEEF